MKSAVKSFLAFYSAACRIIGMVVVPIMILALTGFVLTVYRDANGIYPEYLLYAYAAGGEIMLDFWMFGGICSREENGLEYLKTSKRGRALLQKSVAVDLLRRFVYMMGYGLFCYAFTGYRQEFVSALIMYVVVVAALNVSRHFALWQAHMLVTLGACVLFTTVMVFCGVLGAFLAETVIFGILAAVLSVGTVWHVGFCMRRSYYEK